MSEETLAAPVLFRTAARVVTFGSGTDPGSIVVSMDPSYTPEAETYRKRVREFLEDNLPESWAGVGALSVDEVTEFQAEWRGVLYENGLLAPEWPKEYGGSGLSSLEKVVLAEEFSAVGAPMSGSNDAFSIQMVGNTIIHMGTEDQKRHFLPRILSGEDVWCQGYSEPDAGSDLGNVGCRAELDGDEWLLNGQKIWTSAGQSANMIFVLTRTDASATKHRGISFILCPMDQAGVEVRPIKMISGESEFNEVFFDDARAPKENVVGEVNGGWAVAMTLLGFERGEAAAVQHTAFQAEIARLIELAQKNGTAKDPLVRQQLAWCYTKARIMQINGMRTVTKFLAGKNPGPDAAISKLYWSEYHRVVTELATHILGAEAMAPTGKRPFTAFGPDSPGSDPFDAVSWTDTFLNARAGTIYAGTSQVQRNIIGEHILGLPKEPRSDSGPWNEIGR